ncbi:PREDICTED: translation initiation factor IF-2-like, partial [Chinchilla lanigera]|uniref:translation initiation factor IF-2-like n=1 Tax=Chinchilla lanigera TaxID=34839 RepID=UPI0006976463
MGAYIDLLLAAGAGSKEGPGKPKRGRCETVSPSSADTEYDKLPDADLARKALRHIKRVLSSTLEDEPGVVKFLKMNCRYFTDGKVYGGAVCLLSLESVENEGSRVAGPGVAEPRTPTPAAAPPRPIARGTEEPPQSRTAAGAGPRGGFHPATNTREFPTWPHKPRFLHISAAALQRAYGVRFEPLLQHQVTAHLHLPCPYGTPQPRPKEREGTRQVPPAVRGRGGPSGSGRRSAVSVRGRCALGTGRRWLAPWLRLLSRRRLLLPVARAAGRSGVEIRAANESSDGGACTTGKRNRRRRQEPERAGGTQGGRGGAGRPRAGPSPRRRGRGKDGASARAPQPRRRSQRTKDNGGGLEPAAAGRQRLCLQPAAALMAGGGGRRAGCEPAAG